MSKRKSRKNQTQSIELAQSLNLSPNTNENSNLVHEDDKSSSFSDDDSGASAAKIPPLTFFEATDKPYLYSCLLCKKV
jgi:hypothetical protein